MNNNRKSKEQGQGLLEYGLILVLISVISVGSLYLTGTSIQDVYSSLLCSIQGEDDCQTQVLFFQDFDDEFSDWETGLWANKKRDWWIEDGNLLSDRNASILFDESYDGDYSILLDGVDLTNFRNKSQGLSLHFNSSIDDKKLDGYAFLIEKRKDGDYASILEYANGKPVYPRISEQPLPASFDWNSPGDIQLDVQNDTFTGYINGQQVIQAQDSTYSGGQVGISSLRNSNISVDSIQISTLAP